MEQREGERTKMEQTRMEQQNMGQTALNSCSGPLIIRGHIFTSRFILGSGEYSPDLIQVAVKQVEVQVIILALWRANEGGITNILDYIPSHVTLLPNISGARNTQEAVQVARLSRETGCRDFARIEVIRGAKYLLPGNTETIKAMEIPTEEGLAVMSCTYLDLNTARGLVSAGVACIMPLVTPIGTSRGLCTEEFIQILTNEIDLPIIVDVGVGRPSQACEAMEMGATAVMASTAIVTAGSVPVMAGASELAIETGRQVYLAGPGRTLDKGVSASPPLTGLLHD